MKCVVCRRGDTVPGIATVTLERDALTLVVKNVPAQVCGNCGEEYLDDETTENLLKTAEEEVKAGTQVEVRHYSVSS